MQGGFVKEVMKRVIAPVVLNGVFRVVLVCTLVVYWSLPVDCRWEGLYIHGAWFSTPAPRPQVVLFLGFLCFSIAMSPEVDVGLDQRGECLLEVVSCVVFPWRLCRPS